MTGIGLWLRAAALAVLMPVFVMPPITLDRQVYNVIVVLDITGSMNALDQHLDGVSVSRIAMEKRSVRLLLRTLPCGSRLGLAIFVEAQPFLLFEPVEVCENYAPLEGEIFAIDWRMGWDSESHIAEAVRASIKLAAGLQADLVVMTDGQETPPLAWSDPIHFADLHDTVHGALIGVGGHDFVPIPKFDVYGKEIGVYQPGDVPSEHGGMFRGREHLSAVDEPHLRALSAETGLAYDHLEDEGTLASLLPRVAARRTLPSSVSLRWIPAGLALSLLAAAFWPRRYATRVLLRWRARVPQP